MIARLLSSCPNRWFNLSRLKVGQGFVCRYSPGLIIIAGTTALGTQQLTNVWNAMTASLRNVSFLMLMGYTAPPPIELDR